LVMILYRHENGVVVHDDIIFPGVLFDIGDKGAVIVFQIVRVVVQVVEGDEGNKGERTDDQWCTD